MQETSSYIIQSAVVSILYRIHIHAGRVDASDPSAMAKAEEAYIANLKYAADKCAEVSVHLLATLYPAVQCCKYCGSESAYF